MADIYDELGLGVTPTDAQRRADWSDRDWELLVLLLLAAMAPGAGGSATENTLLATLQRRGTPTDATITGTGASVLAAIPANANRKYLSVQNPSGNAGTFWLNFANAAVTAASPNIEVKPGQGFVMTAADFVTVGAISALGANGEKLTVWQA